MRDNNESANWQRLAWDADHPDAGPNENPFGCGVTDCPETARTDHLCGPHFHLRQRVFDCGMDQEVIDKALGWLFNGADVELVETLITPHERADVYAPVTRPVMRARRPKGLRLKGEQQDHQALVVEQRSGKAGAGWLGKARLGAVRIGAERRGLAGVERNGWARNGSAG